ncbi:MAG: type IV secretion system DNA-binding domain-containing protein [Patescibacteria group bacterium]|nr:type IV secretion system DNA-binding domain-containing protein [Patescibacteria group bacterium]MDD4304256.1 type IV secretion system DNA-binding domain-containing protein [Patescibacteria group bacterium]MDD4695310.1 type IV secretion system DNA-binding domain-containing protein [Patescibacteria group bacterium]
MYLQIGDITISIYIFLIFLVLFFTIIFFIIKKINKSQIDNAFKLKLLKLRVPKFCSDDGKKENIQNFQQKTQERISVIENLYSTLGGMKAQRGINSIIGKRTDHFSLEVVLLDGLIYFYIGLPENSINFFKERIQSVYPDVEIEPVEDYNIFNPDGVVLGSSIRLKNHYIFPIKTYKKIELDPFDSITNSLTKLEIGDSAAIQIIARSSYKRWHKKSSRFTRKVSKTGDLLSARRLLGRGITMNLFFQFINLLLDVFKSESSKNAMKDPNQTPKLSQMEQETLKGIEEKNSKAGLDLNIRIIVSAKTEGTAKIYLDNISNSFSQYNMYEYGNSFFASKVNQNTLISDFIYRKFNDSQRIILNTEELASIYHLPLSSTSTPNISWLEAKKSGAPNNIPSVGISLGRNIYRDKETIIKIKEDDRSRHMYIIGKSGTGKSYYQVNMAIQDIKNGEGICVIDPHGDLIEEILKYIPKERIEDVILFDPSDTERPLGVNMLEFDTQDQKTFVINEMIKIFDKLYDLKATGGPMFEQYMRNAMLLVMEDPESGSTLLEIPRVLADEDFRKYKLSKCKDYLVRDFWEKQAQKAGGEAALANMVPYITSKLTPFITNDVMRPIISQQKSSFNFRKIIDEKKILLINLSKGKIGELNSSLIGMVFVGKILMSALSRVDTSEENRHNFYLYIDEFQNFITDSIAVILSEARKYKLNLVIAHQYITQLIEKGDERIKDAVFGNVGTFVSFRIGVKDAEIVAKQFAPIFSEYDLVNVPAYNAYIKLLIDNYNPPAFSMMTIKRDEPKEQFVKEIKELSRLKYGRDRVIIENEIKNRIMTIGGSISSDMDVA